MKPAPLLEVTNLAKYYPVGSGFFSRPTGWAKAVNGVSFSIGRGESLGLVGESGCGKSTLARLIVRLLRPTDGSIRFGGREIGTLDRRAMRPLRKQMQIIFQDPHASLDPRMKVDAIITEPLRAIQRLTRQHQQEAAAALLGKVGLQKTDLDKYPHEFSGGQRQRIGIARSLCVRPELIVADEPVSALDVSIQAQVINLLDDLKEEFNLSYVFISHDLSVVEHICDRIAVMYLGTVVELATTEDFCVSPRHPYTRALLLAVPLPDPHRKTEPFTIEGDVPSPIDPPTGCAFHPRCPHKFERCSQQKPPLAEAAAGHFVACWLNLGKGMSNDD